LLCPTWPKASKQRKDGCPFCGPQPHNCLSRSEESLNLVFSDLESFNRINPIPPVLPEPEKYQTAFSFLTILETSRVGIEF
jgi:hypothetical protein